MLTNFKYGPGDESLRGTYSVWLNQVDYIHDNVQVDVTIIVS